jgi:hypothetical protein
MDRSKIIKHIKEAAREGHGSRYGGSVRQIGRYRPRNKLAEEGLKKKQKRQNQVPYEVNLNPEINTISQTR